MATKRSWAGRTVKWWIVLGVRIGGPKGQRKWEDWRVTFRVLMWNNATVSTGNTREAARKSGIRHMILGWYVFVFNKHCYFPRPLPWELQCLVSQQVQSSGETLLSWKLLLLVLLTECLWPEVPRTITRSQPTSVLCGKPRHAPGYSAPRTSVLETPFPWEPGSECKTRNWVTCPCAA